MKYFFWIAFAVFLAASIPHVAYFFASFEPTTGPEGIWWWAVSYAIAISIDVTVYLLSWTAFQRYRRFKSWKAVWQHWLLILMCTVFSWAVNWAYAKQFHNPVMLSSAEGAAPWLTSIFPFMASAFPLLGIVYTMMAETITETSAEEKQSQHQQITALADLARQAQLPITSLRRALNVGSSHPDTSNQTSATEEQAKEESRPKEPVEKREREIERPITGQIMMVENDEMTEKLTGSNPTITISTDNTPDKLQMTIEILKSQPQMTDEALAEYLSLKRPASARFWRLKAMEILNAPTQSEGAMQSWKKSDTLAMNRRA